MPCKLCDHCFNAFERKDGKIVCLEHVELDADGKCPAYVWADGNFFGEEHELHD